MKKDLKKKKLLFLVQVPIIPINFIKTQIESINIYVNINRIHGVIYEKREIKYEKEIIDPGPGSYDNNMKKEKQNF